MINKTEVESLIKAIGLKDYKWMHASDILVREWVRMKCTYGCPFFGKSESCPPNTPSVRECLEFLASYNDAIIFHFQFKRSQDEGLHLYAKNINEKMLKLEKGLMDKGYRKAFVLLLGSSISCESFHQKSGEAPARHMQRPSPEALAIDVFQSVEKYGYHPQLSNSSSENVELFTFLLAE